MSATLRLEYQRTFENISKQKPTIVCWGEMARRSIAFIVHIFGSPTAGIKRFLSAAYKDHQSCKVLLYSNSKTNAETSLTNVAQLVLDKHHIAGDAIALTGDSGIMMKTFLMAAFCGEIQTMLNLLCTILCSTPGWGNGCIGFRRTSLLL